MPTVMAIRKLSQDVASRIAAGEVIERPASVTKELIENSIDAGARDVRIEVRQGGRRLIRVIDDGNGIPQDEVELAFERYATSKLRALEELSEISTLGFRGEALPSIAAVSQVTVVTRAQGEEVGTLLRLDGGRVVQCESRGTAQGTVVTVENLFYNTPARLKFMRSITTEARHISELVTCYAMAYPGLRVSLVSDGRTVFQSGGSGNLYDVLVEVYGLDTAQRLLEIQDRSADDSPVTVAGFVSDPLLHRSNARNVTTLVNRRFVRDRLISYAIREAYHGLLPKGRHPIVVLSVELPSRDVDVNVHPAKGEVRFRDTGMVFSAVQKAVRQTLSRRAPVPGDSASFGWERVIEARQRRLVDAGHRPSARLGELALEVQRTARPLPPAEEAPVRDKLPMLRVLGQLGLTYIIAEGPTGMYLIDQHAAHERVLYERLQSQRGRSAVVSQTLVEPMTIEPGPRLPAIDEERLAKLRDLGFDLEHFGARTYLVRSVPAIVQTAELAQSILDIIEEAERADGVRPWEEEIIIGLACHGATRAGQALAMEQMRELILELEQTSLPRTCPHGRPTMLHVSAEQLEREFGRR
ncbi:MAG TPA: DNA mismatch repair endonuclease MutL [Anaerolineae bacterium]|nr:DNA mismatch repair endonuclease MutL [Anaerolineae bacterium]